MAQCTNPRHREESWMLADARGIPVGSVCDTCEAQVRAKYRLDIFTNPHYDADEYIEEEDWGW